MFAAIAPHYDFLNHLLSLNIDRRWRRQAVGSLGWENAPQDTYLDLCAGTMDLAAELASQPGFGGSVVGADFVVPMLALGRGKTARLTAVGADALCLPFNDESFAGCTVGFGVRNLTDLDRGLTEIARVLKPGSRAVILEFSTPTRWPVRQLYLGYFLYLLPAVGWLVTQHRSAYRYLPSSVLDFPKPEQFATRMELAGFRDISQRRLTMGIAMLHVGTRR
jgi:demethylmenaquinone methyltransferase/2-methoxy-6-polyprenyl-1,4-benzoquinol methylase